MIARITPKPVIRGVQLSTGVLLMSGGIRFMMGTSRFQELENAVEPYLALQALGPVPITLASNLAAGFIAGMVVAHLLRWEKLSV